MFTGIVQTTAKIAWINKTDLFMRYAVAFPDFMLKDLQTGASVAVQGVCQTVVAINGNEVTFEAIAETLLKTNLNALEPEQWVNLERSAKLGDEIGGHILSGHVYGTGVIQSITALDDNQRVVKMQCAPSIMKYIFSKGYIALNGASLTVVDVDTKGSFTVHLIPETLRLTTFGESQIGDKINIEIDNQTQTIVESIERILAVKTRE